MLLKKLSVLVLKKNKGICIVKVGEESFKFCIVIIKVLYHLQGNMQISTILLGLLSFMNKQVQVKILTSKNITVLFYRSVILF